MTDIIAMLKPGDWLTPTGGPRYLQLRSRIQHAIDAAVLKDNDPLPSEREIAAITDLSRVTVRKAVAELVQSEMIVRRRGSGSFVAPKINRVEQSLSALTSFTEDMARRGKKVTTEWLERGIFAPSPEETFNLGLSSTEKVSRLSRLRKADGAPLAIERASLSVDILPDPTLVENSLYAMLEQNGRRPVRAIQRISAYNITGDDAHKLEVEPNMAGLNIERISYLASGKAVEFTTSIYRGDAYDFVAELKIPR